MASAVAYLRVSTAKQVEKGVSLDTQIAAIRAYAETHGRDGKRRFRMRYLIGGIVAGVLYVAWHRVRGNPYSARLAGRLAARDNPT